MIGRREKQPVSDEAELKGFDDFDLRLGDVMRGERATLGKSLLDVQRELKIKAAYISAIENSDPSAFESQGFVAGYVRSYSRYLGLDPEWAYSRFCRESNFQTEDGITSGSAQKVKKKPTARVVSVDPLADPDKVFVPRPEGVLSRVDPSAFGSLLVLVMLISALGYGGWAVFREVQKVQFVPVDQAPGISGQVDILDPAAGQGTTDVANADNLQAPTTAALDRLYRPSALDVPVMVARDGPIAAINPAEVGTLAPVGGAPVASTAETIAVATQEGDAAATPLVPVQVVETAPEPIVVFAVRPSWVRVRGADGTVLFEKILDAGEQYQLPVTEQAPQLRAGNAGSVYFTINGETYGPAGDGPSVIKGVALSTEALLASYEQADPNADADLARFFALASNN